MDKISRHEAVQLGLKHYYTGKLCKHGHIAKRLVCSWACTECSKITSREYQASRPARERAEAMRRWRSENPERALAASRRQYTSNRKNRLVAARVYRTANRQEVLSRLRKWQAENPEKARAAARKWAAKNRVKLRSDKAARRASERNATPSWVDKAVLQKIYAAASRAGMEVDHIVPLKHPQVCGLHVPCNLQLLTKSENCSKRNHFEIGV